MGDFTGWRIYNLAESCPDGHALTARSIRGVHLYVRRAADCDYIAFGIFAMATGLPEVIAVNAVIIALLLWVARSAAL